MGDAYGMWQFCYYKIVHRMTVERERASEVRNWSGNRTLTVFYNDDLHQDLNKGIECSTNI